MLTLLSQVLDYNFSTSKCMSSINKLVDTILQIQYIIELIFLLNFVHSFIVIIIFLISL